MQRWTIDLFDGEFDRRDFLRWCGAGAAGAMTGMAGCSGGDGEGDGDGEGGGQETETDTPSSGGGGQETETDKPSSGGGSDISGQMTMSIAAEPWNLDYALYQDTGSGYLIDSIYDNLVTYQKADGGGLELAPSLAKEMPMVNDDLTRYEFKLREGVMFHGGEKEMTAEDAAYSMNWLLEEPAKNVTGFVKPYVNEAKAPDDYTLVMDLKQPWALLPEYLTRVYRVVRKGAHGELGSDYKGPTGQASALTEGPRKDMAASTGPWYVTEWQSGSHLVMKAHEDYWMENTPRVKTIRFEIIPETSTKLAALRSGDVDMIDVVPFREFDSLKQRPNIKAESVTGTKTEVMYFNNQSGIFSGDKGRHLRKAVDYGINRKAVVNDIFYGMATPQWSPIWPGKFVPEDIKWKNQDWTQDEQVREQKVQSELEAAGKPDGFEFTCVATQAQWFVDMAQLIAGQLRPYGITMNVKPMKKGPLFDIVYGGPDAPYEAAIEDYGIPMPVPEYWLWDGYADVPNHLRWLEDKDAPGGKTTTPWVSEFKQNVTNAIQASTEQERMENLAKAQRTTVEQAGQANIAYIQLSRGWRNRVKNYPGPYQNNKQEFRPVYLED